jgi:hypothetical protein
MAKKNPRSYALASGKHLWLIFPIGYHWENKHPRKEDKDTALGHLLTLIFQNRNSVWEQFSRSLSRKVFYGTGARKHPLNKGRVSGEGVSFARHIFNPSPVF